MVVVQEHLVAWTLAGLSLVLLVTATTLNGIFAFSLDTLTPAFQLLAFMAFATNILAICSLVLVISHCIPVLKRGSVVQSSTFRWRLLSLPITTSSVAALLSFITLVWMAATTVDLAGEIVGRRSKTIMAVWFAVWGICTMLQIGAYAFIASWTRRSFCRQPLTAMTLDFEVGSTGLGEDLAQGRGRSASFRSQDPTLTSTPQTPTSIKVSNPLGLSHSSGKATPTSSRTRLVHATSFTGDSVRSSLDYPTREPVSVEHHPFDNWDTSDVTREIRTTLQATPPVTRSGLETIPGSRPESPAKALDGPFLPDSPHTLSSDTVPAREGTGLSCSPNASISSPPSSLPNFSRPTSRQINSPMASSALCTARPEPSPETSIHPLFRANSPHPTPIATTGTTVTASPLAGQSISSMTLTRIRSSSIPQQPSPLKASELPPARPNSPPDSPGPGSPGPSLVDEDGLSPVIPGFILSAGPRSSLVDYGRRKSVKDRSSSLHSQGGRLSTIIP